MASTVTRMGISVSIATGLYGISFGALAVASGLDVIATQLLSILMFTGGSQFAFIATLAGGGWSAVATASLLGVRNAIYAAQINASLRPVGWRRFAAAHVTIDESVAVSMAQTRESDQRRAFWITGWGVFVCWNILTLVGALAAQTLDPKAWGLDGAAVAAFIGLLWPRLRAGDAIAIATIAGVVTLLTTPFAPLGTPILIAASVSALIGWVRR